jgi:hypothetical protein
VARLHEQGHRQGNIGPLFPPNVCLKRLVHGLNNNLLSGDATIGDAWANSTLGRQRADVGSMSLKSGWILQVQVLRQGREVMPRGHFSLWPDQRQHAREQSV